MLRYLIKQVFIQTSINNFFDLLINNNLIKLLDD